MRGIPEKKFTKTWQSLKSTPGVSSNAWFKKADTAVFKKLDAYQKALEKAKSGLIGDLLKLGKALEQLEDALYKLIDPKGLALLTAEMPKKAAAVAEINRYKAKVRHERSTFEARLKSAVAAADNDIQRLEALDPARKKELWKGFGVEL